MKINYENVLDGTTCPRPLILQIAPKTTTETGWTNKPEEEIK
jgi:hypothetical protein